MPIRYTYDQVKQLIYEKSQGQVKLVSEEYYNSNTPLLYECKCGSIFKRKFNKFIQGQIWCNTCSKENVANLYRKDINEIISEIEKAGCHYISGEYRNSASLLYIQCKCGKYFYKSWQKFQTGQNHCPDCGMKNLADSKRKYNYELAKAEFAKYGYTMIDDTFIDVSTKTHCLCKRGHDCYLTISGIKQHRSGCMICSNIDHSGEKHHNYKGGISLLEEKIRQGLSEWFHSIRVLYNNRCPITGAYGTNADVHHLNALSNIFYDVCKELNFTVSKRNTLNETNLTDEELKLLIDTIIAKHHLSTGILISSEVHKQFHKQYGYGNNTPEQFNDFLCKNYKTSLDEVQKGKIKYIPLLF